MALKLNLLIVALDAGTKSTALLTTPPQILSYLTILSAYSYTSLVLENITLAVFLLIGIMRATKFSNSYIRNIRNGFTHRFVRRSSSCRR
jgi:hypothetical protein